MTLRAQGKVGAALLLFAGVFHACTCGSPVDDPSSTVPGACQQNPPLIQTTKTDILFVVDNSNSMKEEQDEVADELPAFVEELRRDAGVPQDFRVGLITTGIYRNLIPGITSPDYREYPDESGKLRPVPLPDGGIPSTAERFLEDDDPELIEKFRLLVRQGIVGSGQETPFEAVRLAVSEPLSTTSVAEGGNGGFLRDGARLMVVVVTDEDDCSEATRPVQVQVGNDQSRDYCTEQTAKLSPVSDYFNVFKDLKDSTGASREVLWAAIAPVSVTTKEVGAEAGPVSVRNIGCDSSRGPGFRHREMASLFDSTLKNLDSVCKPDFRQSLIDIAAIAANTQSLDVAGIPDGRLIKAELTRADGTVANCTVSNGGITFERGDEDTPSRIVFQPSCARERTDLNIAIKLFCAG